MDTILGPPPDELASYEQWQRRTHADLSSWSQGQLRAERQRVRFRLLIPGKHDPWFVERLDVVEEALRHVS